MPAPHGSCTVLLALFAAAICLALSVHAQQPAESIATPPTATEAAVASVDPAAGATATDAYSGFRREFDAGRYVESVPYARRVLELAEQEAEAPAAEEVQVALMNLGMAQNLAQDYVGAEESFLRVIKLIESSGRPLHARLARAHAGLASAYHDGKRHDLAVQSFNQAIALARRNEGLLTDQQVPLIEKYIDSLTQLGRYEDALKAQKYLLRIATRKHGPDGIGLVPTLEQIGRWFTSLGAYDQARQALKRAIEIVETAEGDKSQRLVGPLVAIAACNRRQLLDPLQQLPSGPETERATLFQDTTTASSSLGYTAGMIGTEGEKALLRAADITDSQPVPSLAQVVSVRTQLGDWYQLRSQPDRARPHYRLAWQAAQKITDRIDGKTYAEAVFGQPLLLHLVRPEGWNRYSSKAADEVEIRNVVVEFTVNALGRVEAPKIVDDSGDEKRAARTESALEGTARYRPRFEGGEPVATQGVVHTQPWTLLLPPPPAPPAEAKPQA